MAKFLKIDDKEDPSCSMGRGRVQGLCLGRRMVLICSPRETKSCALLKAVSASWLDKEDAAGAAAHGYGGVTAQRVRKMARQGVEYGL